MSVQTIYTCDGCGKAMQTFYRVTRGAAPGETLRYMGEPYDKQFCSVPCLVASLPPPPAPRRNEVAEIAALSLALQQRADLQRPFNE